jgi:hypothetical protein
MDELKQKIEAKRSELDAAIENSANIGDVYSISLEMDELIGQYIDMTNPKGSIEHK